MYGGDVLLNNDDRYVRAEEFIIVLRGMWTQTPFSFDGQFYKVKESQLLLKPATVAAAGDLHRQPQRARAGDGGEIRRLVVPRLRQERRPTLPA